MITRLIYGVATRRPRVDVLQQLVPNMLSAAQVAETYFLESRHMLLEIAAHFDRYDAAVARESGGIANGRAASGQGGNGSMARLREAVAILAAPHADRERTETLLELFAKD
jgi:hypothetical protein